MHPLMIQNAFVGQSDLSDISYLLTTRRPGDQHRDTKATTNPFIEQKPHVTEFTAQEIATLQSRLEKQLGPEYISTRPGAGGGKVHYLAAEKVINLANEVFGFNGWSSAIQNVQIDFVDENPENGKITLGLSTIVRVTLRDGTFHEDIGYGHIENCKGKAAAFEKAKKEAATDAMKRALRNFGNVLGNCLYDKDYLSKVTKVKVAPTKWDAENLHRHPDYAPIKREALADAESPRVNQTNGAAPRRQTSVQSAVSYGSMEFDDDFGGNPFDDTDFTHPDEVRLDDTSNMGAVPTNKPVAAVANGGMQQRQGVSRMQSMPQLRPPNVQPPPAVQQPQAPQRPSGPIRPPHNLAQPQANRPPAPQAANHPQRPQTSVTSGQAQLDGSSSETLNTTGSTSNTIIHQQQPRGPVAHTRNSLSGEQPDQQDQQAPRMPPPGNPEGFVTGRSVDLLNQPPESRPPPSSMAFNPHADSPSIRRTQGINPGKSAPVLRQAINGAATTNGQHTPAPVSAPVSVPLSGQIVPPQQQPQQAQQQSNGLNGAATPIRTNYVNPSADMNRRIGMPPSAASHTIQNRTTYKPPTTLKRPPLTDVSNIQMVDGTGDPKKAKIDPNATFDGEVQNAVAAPEAV